MERIREIINLLQETPGTNDKIDILKYMKKINLYCLVVF